MSGVLMLQGDLDILRLKSLNLLTGLALSFPSLPSVSIHCFLVIFGEWHLDYRSLCKEVLVMLAESYPDDLF